MLKKISLLKTKTVPLVGIFLLTACGSGTPNSVSLTATQGVCVTSVSPGYESMTTQYSAAYPINATLPANSPYCVALTITNNNSGTNANNVQVAQSGFSLSYAFGGTSYSYNLADFNAAGIPQGTFPYTANQSAYNMALFDPNNCVTTIGANVRTLNKGGGSCTFYLQLIGESLPIGVYPLTAAVSYTNGNSYYSTSIGLNQRSNLYLGGNLSQNLAITNAQGSSNGVISANYPGSNAVNTVVRDPFGNIYSGDNQGVVYKYNGTSASSWTNMGTTSLLPIYAMTSDSSGNIYYVDAGGKVFQISATGIISAMGSISGITASSMLVNGSSLYISTLYNTNIYTCSLTSISANSCSGEFFSGPESASAIFQIMNANAPVVATNTGIYSSYNQLWQYFYGGLPESIVTSIAYYPSASNPSWFAAVNSTESTNSSIFIQSSTNNFVPFTGSSNNIIYGQTPLVTIDAARGVFVAGAALASADFTASNVYLAYVPASLLGLSSTPWTPITGINNVINAMQTASQLTPY